MTRQIPPDGNSLRPLKGIIIDLGNALQPDIYPGADIDRRLAAMQPRVVVPRPPYLALIVAFALTGAGGFGAGWFINKAMANAAATAIQAEAGE